MKKQFFAFKINGKPGWLYSDIKSNGYTIKQFCNKSGLLPSSLSRINSGKSKGSLNFWKIYSKYISKGIGQ